jgi:hypothetical protein
MSKHIEPCEKIAQAMIQDGVEDGDLEHVLIPPLFEDWDYPVFYSMNLRFFYQQLSK